MPSFSTRVPEGDTAPRQVCDDCGYVAYDNPKIVTGAVVVAPTPMGDQVLLCRRAIEPRRGFWTLPAGYLELNETVAEGAIREAHEEALADIVLDGVLAIYSIARIGQVQILYRARFAGPPVFAPGVESLDVRLFAWDDVPWDELAFPTVHWALHAWRAVGDGMLGAPAVNPASDPRGMSPERPVLAA